LGGGALEVYKWCREYPSILQTSNLKILHVWAVFLTLAPKPCRLTDGQTGLPTFRRNVLLVISEVDFTLKMEAACYFEA